MSFRSLSIFGLALLLCPFFLRAKYIPPMKILASDSDRSLIAAAYNSPARPPLLENDWVLAISVRNQRLVAARNGVIHFVYSVSTATAGTGSLANSEKTPLGWHSVSEWIGENAVPGQVFVSRRPTSEIIPYSEWRSNASADKVLTRILWLSGLEPGINQGGNIDSHARFIYLHGTNQEHLIGRPASHGCIRMFNRDVMELFEATFHSRTFCWIVESLP